MRRHDRILLLFLLPGAIGFAALYLVPFAASTYYALVENMMTKRFVGLSNFRAVLTSDAFRLGLRNTLRFMLVGVPLGLAIAYIVAGTLRRWERVGHVAAARTVLVLLLLPLVVPSGSVVFFWRTLYGDAGMLNRALLALGVVPIDWLAGDRAMGAAIVVYTWKSVGYSIVLLLSGLQTIPEEYYEAMRVEGGGARHAFWHVTRVYLSPMAVVALLMAIVNSFKVFREIYMLCGAYPSTGLYQLQHYMNNQFYALDLPRMSAASDLLALGICAVVAFLLRAQRRLLRGVEGWL